MRKRIFQLISADENGWLHFPEPFSECIIISWKFSSDGRICGPILTNYNENATVLLSTHLISDIENVLDRVIFLQNGQLALNETVDEIRTTYGKSVDALFREVFKC